MKTTFAFVAALALPFTTLACSAPPDAQKIDVPAISASGVHTQDINEGGCTGEQLALGWYEVDGECYGPGGGGGSGGGGGGSTCFQRCSIANDRCYQRCDLHGSSDSCYAACDKTLVNCGKACP
jgi:hypothetical protein